MKFKKKYTCSTIELTPELAQQIYNDANGYETASEMFNNDCGYDWTNVEKVFEFAKKIIAG